MDLRSVFVFLLVTTLFSCKGEAENAGSVESKEGTDQTSGKTLFEENCAACHGTDGKLGASGAKDLTTSSMNDEDITRIIRMGKNGMPPMESLLGSDENVQAVTDYVKSMRK